jgi:Ca2+/Na+ antiporter
VAAAVVARPGLPSDLVESTLTTAVTSLPELVTLIAAVRIGAPAVFLYRKSRVEGYKWVKACLGG